MLRASSPKLTPMILSPSDKLFVFLHPTGLIPRKHKLPEHIARTAHTFRGSTKAECFSQFCYARDRDPGSTLSSFLISFRDAKKDATFCDF